MTIAMVDPESVGLCSDRLERIREWMSAQVDSERLAGLSVLVARHGRIAFLETAGLADRERGTPFDEQTLVRLYSMTKPVTSVAAMMCFEAGAFQLDDPVAAYLPAFGRTRVWAGGRAPLSETLPQQEPMTVRQLLTHTSGLTYGFMQTNVVDARYRELGIEFQRQNCTLAEMVERLAEIPLICQPGSAWNYSVATDVLGRLVEIWSGLSLAEFFERRIFKPLRMPDTGFHVAPHNHERFATLYAPLSGRRLGDVGPMQDGQPIGLKLEDAAATSHYLQPTTIYSGGGGLVGTLADYARFCQMLLNGGELEGARILGRKTVQFMRRNHLPDNRDMAAMGQPMWSETSYEGVGFGLGFAVVLDPVKAQILTSVGEHHWGGAASTFFWLDPEESLFVILLTQLMPSSTYPLRRELRPRVYQALIDG